MNVTFYSGFEKRRNSTKRPTGGTSKSVALKENTSLMRPAFLVSDVTWSWNYCTAWQYYYYITDIVAESNGLFRVECEVDVLATFKVSIGNYTTLISRAAADQNYDVIDSIYPAMARPTTKRTSIANPGIFTTNRSNGTYIVGVIGTGGVKFLAMDQSKFSAFCRTLMPAWSGGTIDTWLFTQIDQAFVGGLGSILQNIVLLKWLPVSFTSISPLTTPDSNIHVGNFIVPNFTGNVLQSATTIQLLGQTITFPDRDDAGARGRWLYQQPFASYSVYIPPFGLLNIDGAYMAGSGRQVTADIMIEAVSGNVTLRLYYALGARGVKMIGVYNADISQNVAIGGASADVGGFIGGVAGAIAAYAQEQWAGVIGGIASAASAGVPNTSTAGGGISGPSPDLDAVWYAYATYFDPIEENRAELGRPLAEVRQISSLSGYVQCADAHCPIMGYEAEMIKVNEMLNTGIFYE